jgi:hypothetical protein
MVDRYWKLVVTICLVALLIGSSTAVTCFGRNGYPVNDSVICPGSQACCNSTSACQTNRLCHNTDDPPGIFHRGSCAVVPYNPNVCADLCLYSAYISPILDLKSQGREARADMASRFNNRLCTSSDYLR